MFDIVCKFLVETFSTDFATWLLGESVTLSEISPSELSLEPIRADALMLLQSEQMVLHLEFQTQPGPAIPFRLLDYRVRGYRRFPGKPMRQIVIYLQQSRSALVRQTTFELENTRHQFEVMRLWEQPTESLMAAPGLLPFAVLSQTDDRAATLQQVAEQIEQISASRVQSNVAAATAILSGLVLEKGLIQSILRRELMQESVIYQEIKAEGIQEGIQQGIQEGIQQGIQQGIQERTREERQLALRLLTRKVGEIPDDYCDRIEQLNLSQVEALIEALLDFERLDDLANWLAAQNQQSEEL
ncbi:MAG: Rpn family recombination-promoting nuclease/putative transposase [Leptolyngbya sp. SIO4C1]|nr:Rpn family recombination-promoting nuclease/putative transposase [Leptolyngbya sp. SIO4C1]